MICSESETLKEHFRGLRFRDITPRSVEKFILGRLDSDSRRKSQRSPVSVHKEFSLLSSIFNMAMREEVAACNPCFKISKKVREKIPARNKRDRFMSLEEEDKLFNLGLVGSRAHFRPIVRLGVHLGARLGELMAIKRSDINLSTKPFSVKLRSKGQDVKVFRDSVARALAKKDPRANRLNFLGSITAVSETRLVFIFINLHHPGEECSKSSKGLRAAHQIPVGPVRMTIDAS